MIVVNSHDRLFYAPTRKAVPGLVSEMATSLKVGVEAIVSGSGYFEFNTREQRTGEVGPFQPLSNLVVVSCGLVPQAGEEEETEDDAE